MAARPITASFKALIFQGGCHETTGQAPSPLGSEFSEIRSGKGLHVDGVPGHGHESERSGGG